MIRPATIEEAEALAELQLRTALYAYKDIFPPEAPPPTVDELAERWARDVSAATSRTFVAVHDGKLVGVVLSGPDAAEPDIGHLSRLYVDPDRWGRGIGRSLYDTCLAHLTDAGFDAATLWVLERNLRAREWYERLGWELTEARRTVYAPHGIDDVQYRFPALDSRPRHVAPWLRG